MRGICEFAPRVLFNLAMDSPVPQLNFSARNVAGCASDLYWDDSVCVPRILAVSRASLSSLGKCEALDLYDVTRIVNRDEPSIFKNIGTVPVYAQAPPRDCAVIWRKPEIAFSTPSDFGRCADDFKQPRLAFIGVNFTESPFQCFGTHEKEAEENH
jgi:hypothetical protein